MAFHGIVLLREDQYQEETNEAQGQNIMVDGVRTEKLVFPS
jgi:hypothetical protein